MRFSTGIRMGLTAALLAAAWPAVSIAQDAGSDDPVKGRKIAQDLCSRCHSIEVTGPSPLPKAPPFRDLGKAYPPEALAEALAEGILTGHPTMPQVELEPEDIGHFIAFLKKLQADAKKQ